MFTKEETKLTKACYESIKKIAPEWEWEPELGEKCLYKRSVQKGALWMVTRICGKYHVQLNCKYDRDIPISDCIPLLCWEKLEGIMEGTGYIVSIRRNLEKEIVKGRFCCEIEKGFDFPSYFECAETRQLAVMKAILALAESFRR